MDSSPLIGRLGTLSYFSVICDKSDNFCGFLSAPLHIKTYPERIYTKRKEYAPNGSIFFPLRVDLFKGGGGRQNILDWDIFPESESMPIKYLHSIFYLQLKHTIFTVLVRIYTPEKRCRSRPDTSEYGVRLLLTSSFLRASCKMNMFKC